MVSPRLRILWREQHRIGDGREQELFHHPARDRRDLKQPAGGGRDGIYRCASRCAEFNHRLLPSERIMPAKTQIVVRDRPPSRSDAGEKIAALQAANTSPSAPCAATGASSSAIQARAPDAEPEERDRRSKQHAQKGYSPCHPHPTAASWRPGTEPPHRHLPEPWAGGAVRRAILRGYSLLLPARSRPA